MRAEIDEDSRIKSGGNKKAEIGLTVSLLREQSEAKKQEVRSET